MRERRITRPPRIASAALTGAVALCTVGVAYLATGAEHSRPAAEKYALAHVRRADLHPALTASGRIESSKRTIIECELENISIGVLGERLSAGGASVLLSIVPEGSVVHRGDVLAVLDSSDYEELLRQQRMTVERSRADFRQAELNLEIAKLAVREFRDGSMAEAVKEFQGSLALAESDLERVKDRLNWVRRLKAKGYVPTAQVTNEEFNYARALFALGEQRAAFNLFTRWMAPRSLKVLENQVLGEEATLDYQSLRLKRNLDRLAKLEKQVERCTIHAPHDGFVIYANDQRRDVVIEPGMFVRQKQDLMYLPDLNEMEVVASIHESVLTEVSHGMRAQVYIEGMANRRLEGHVTQVAQIPTYNWRSDVRYFDSVVKLDHAPKGILPGMTAQVQIELERKAQVLTVPAEAVAHEDGREFCYVVHDDGLERREVKLGEATPDLLEISRGLHEGEQVVLNPVHSVVQEDAIDETPLHPELTLSEDNQLTPSDALHPAREVAALN
jgi:HlyD family secretion protein